MVPSIAGGFVGLGLVASALSFDLIDSDRVRVLSGYALEADQCCRLIYFRPRTLINHGLQPGGERERTGFLRADFSIGISHRFYDRFW
jgi:hypothetical protein